VHTRWEQGLPHRLRSGRCRFAGWQEQRQGEAEFDGLGAETSVWFWRDSVSDHPGGRRRCGNWRGASFTPSTRDSRGAGTVLSLRDVPIGDCGGRRKMARKVTGRRSGRECRLASPWSSPRHEIKVPYFQKNEDQPLPFRDSRFFTHPSVPVRERPRRGANNT